MQYPNLIPMNYNSGSMSIALKGGWVVTQNKNRDIIKADILIENGRISQIGEIGPADEIIDASGCAIIPGLINAHTHVSMTLMRGIADEKLGKISKDFAEALDKYTDAYENVKIIASKKTVMSADEHFKLTLKIFGEKNDAKSAEVRTAQTKHYMKLFNDFTDCARKEFKIGAL